MLWKMCEQIRIAFIEHDAGIGGAEVNLFYLFNGMNGNRFRPLVVVPYEGPLTRRLREMGVEYRLVRQVKFISTSTFIFGRKIFNPLAVLYDILVFIPTVWRLQRLLKGERIHVVHTNTIFSHVYGALAAKLAGVPCVWHIQDIVDPKMALGLVRKALVFLGGILPCKIVVVSNAVGAMFNGRSAAKVRIVYNGADTERFSPDVDGSVIRREFNIAEDELVIGMVGRLTQWKGQREFLRAASLVAKEIKKIKFLIVGDATFSDGAFVNDLEELTKELELTGKVIFTGFRRDVPGLIATMDICVLPSVLPDPCPLVMFDYGAGGKPVVASAIGGIPEIVINGETGFLVKPGNWKELADGILHSAKNKDLRQSMGIKARMHIEENYSAANFIKNMCDVYKAVSC